MQFALKVQRLEPTIKSNKKYLATTFEFEAPSEKLLEKRGILFSVSSMSAVKEFDLDTATTLFLDTVKENYYRTNDDTPLHAVEKALKRAINILQSFKSNDSKLTLSSKEAAFKLTFCTALIWNRVLYTSYVGKPAVYLVRGSGVRDLGANNASNEIWTNSSLLADDDVVIIGTEQFAQTFPTSEITSNLGGLANAIERSPNKELLAAILIKATSKTNKKSKTLLETVSSSNMRQMISSAVLKFKDRATKKGYLSDKFKLSQSKKTAPVSSINNNLSQSGTSTGANVTTGMSYKRLSSTKRSSNKRALIAGLVMVSILGYTSFKLFIEQNGKFSEEDISSRITNSKLAGKYNVKGAATKPSPLISHKEVFDIKDLFNEIFPIGIANLGNNKIGVIDKKSHTLYSVDIKNTTYKKISGEFEDPEYLNCADNLCYIVDGKTIKVINPSSPEKIDKYLADLDGIADIKPYRNNIYTLTSTNIYKQTLQTDTPVKWLVKGQIIENAKSFAVDNDVYVLFNRNISKYSNGKLQRAFKIDNSYLLSPTQIHVNDNYLFVLDSLRKSIIVYNKLTGNFEKEIILTDRTDNETPEFFTLISSKKMNLVFLKGNSLYVVD